MVTVGNSTCSEIANMKLSIEMINESVVAMLGLIDTGGDKKIPDKVLD